MLGPRQERRGEIYELESSSQPLRKTPGSGRRHFGEEKKRAQSMTQSSCRAGTAGGHRGEFLSTECKAGGTQIPIVQASSRHLPGTRGYCGPLLVPLQTERAGDGLDTENLNLVPVRNDERLAYCTGRKDGVTATGDGGPPGALQPGMM